MDRAFLVTQTDKNGHDIQLVCLDAKTAARAASGLSCCDIEQVQLVRENDKILYQVFIFANELNMENDVGHRVYICYDTHYKDGDVVCVKFGNECSTHLCIIATEADSSEDAWDKAKEHLKKWLEEEAKSEK